MLARCCFAASLLRGLTASVPAGGAARHRDDPRLHRRPGDQLLRHRQRERLAPRRPAPRCLSIVSADTPAGRRAAQVYEGYDRVRSDDHVSEGKVAELICGKAFATRQRGEFVVATKVGSPLPVNGDYFSRIFVKS